MSNKGQEKKVQNEVKMSVGDILQLNAELQALNREKEINFVTKYRIIVLYELTKRISERFNSTKLDLLKKYGKESKRIKGSYDLNLATPANYKIGIAELEKLAKVEETFTDFSFDMKDFEDIKSENGYIQFFKFLKIK